MKERFQVTPAAYVLLVKGGKIFLIKRANTGFCDGHWGLPAGHFEGGETAIKAAQ